MTVRIVALDEIAEISAGNPAPQNAADFSDDGEPFVRMQDVGREHHTRTLSQTVDRVSVEAIERHRLRRYPTGTLLIPKSGASINLNHRALLARDAFVVSHLATVIPDTSQIDAEYLYFWSLSYDPRSQAQTTSLPSLPTSLIKAAQIPLPPLPEQRRLVDLLSRAEGIVRLRREAQAKAAELIPALFLDMFGDPAGNPKGWPVVEFGEYLAIPSSVKTPDLEVEVDLPCIGADSIESGTGKIVSWPTVGDIRPISGKYFFEKDDVLYSKIRPALRKAILAPSNGYCSADMYPLRPTQDRATPEFVVALLLSKDFTDYAIGVSMRAQMPKVNRETLFAYKAPLPPIDLQHQFAAKVEAVRAIATQQTAALTTAKATFDALLHQAFQR